VVGLLAVHVVEGGGVVGLRCAWLLEVITRERRRLARVGSHPPSPLPLRSCKQQQTKFQGWVAGWIWIPRPGHFLLFPHPQLGHPIHYPPGEFEQRESISLSQSLLVPGRYLSQPNYYNKLYTQKSGILHIPCPPLLSPTFTHIY
jgi:hypothetical protein